MIASAERWIGSRQRWSGMRARPSQARQKRVVAAIRALGLVDVVGRREALGPGERAVGAFARPRARAGPGRGRPRCRARGPSASRIVWPAPVASAACRPPSTSVHSAGVAAVVEDRLADELDLDAALEALDRAHEHVVGVVVGRRPRVRRDLVLVVARAHGQRVADDDPAGRRLPGRRRARSSRARTTRAVGMVDAERPEPERRRPRRSSRLPKTLGESKRGHAEPVDRAVGRDERAGVAVGEERVVGDRRERRRRGGALRGRSWPVSRRS